MPQFSAIMRALTAVTRLCGAYNPFVMPSAISISRSARSTVIIIHSDQKRLQLTYFRAGILVAKIVILVVGMPFNLDKSNLVTLQTLAQRQP